ncbi:MAG: N-methyltransferase (ISS) [Trebouxia sp. A1-2]|nr:MAG: N-methyltransferase (ISS) [Trebouxia sp. A1-2]
MAAATAINTGDSVVTLPRTAALLVTPKMKCPFPDLIDQAYWAKSQWFEKMALMLLHERKKGKNSAVSGYIEQLPARFDTLFHWSPEELQLLMYPPLIQQVQQQKQYWHDHYKNVKAASSDNPVGEDELVWALECVRSRAFSGPYSGESQTTGLTAQTPVIARYCWSPPVKDRAKLVLPFVLAALAYTQVAHLPLEQILNGAIAAVLFNIIYDTLLSRKLRWFAMCPVIDSMNHQSTSTNEVAYEYFGDRFSVTAERKYKQGEQVFITYGQQSNDKLLQYYGFVESKNPADVYVVTNMLHALQDLPYLNITKERIQCVQQAGLLPSLEQVA